MSGSRFTLPNIITVARIALCPVIFWLAISPGAPARFGAFVLFVVAGLSDVWDGYLARRYDLITDIGKLLDPIADKLLLVVTFVPFYMVSHRGTELDLMPWPFGQMPMWVMVVILGRELFITLFRQYAVRRGVVIAAGKSGKFKALFQSLFVGALLLLYPLRIVALDRGWEGGSVWAAWSWFHGAWVSVTLAIAIVLRRFFGRYQTIEQREGDEWAIKVLTEYQHKEQIGGRYWRCLINGEEVGAAWQSVTDTRATLHLAVKPEYWGHVGVCGLVKQLVDRLPVVDFRVDLYLGSSNHHRRAVSLLKGLGFMEMVQPRLLMLKEIR
jgi:CDP-diacylglycerol--glycerol-3-phosphate 3-phosphatidyltransferase